ncbi:MAG: type transport system ATP-binding protein [Myxococcales bacterium]|jgi:ABC-2 type transport system ATP-binding protein|nr:type transport system ATP-binding protein [Myxococcales bacterium]
MSALGPTLELGDLSAVRAGARVLDRVSLTVAAGEIVAVIGPNGAGKTTLLEAIIGVIPLVAGQVSVGGRRLHGLGDRARWFDYLSGEAEPPSEVRVGDLLAPEFVRERIDPISLRSLKARLGLDPLTRVRTGALSRGERRRVLLFQALASGKPFILLDEPTGVFDPLQLLDVTALLRETASRGSGLLITVHQMSDAEAIADRIALLDRGRIIAAGTLAELRERAAVSTTASLQEIFLALLSKPNHANAESHAPS